MFRSPLLGMAVALTIALTACATRPEPDATGEEIFTIMCARCHGADLGGRVGPSLGPGSDAAAAADEFLRMTITRGRGRMPSFAHSLTVDQVERVIGFLREKQG